jgi:2-oxo-4-hydroxy-4-carboxy-5-ureidoimidazoline decarboxylase
VRLNDFNAAPSAVATPALLACCDVPAWAAAVLDQRPYPDLESVLDVADKAARELTAADVDRALAAHPRIGERAEGPGTEAELSREEQSGVSTDADTRAALHEGNHAYEQRFGRVFLICATGRSADEILAALRERLENDEQTEAAVVAEELRKIALLRLRKLLAR